MSTPTELERVISRIGALHPKYYVSEIVYIHDVKGTIEAIEVYAQTVAEEAVRVEREKIRHELDDEYHMHMKGGAVQDFIKEMQENLTLPTK